MALAGRFTPIRNDRLAFSSRDENRKTRNTPKMIGSSGSTLFHDGESLLFNLKLLQTVKVFRDQNGSFPPFISLGVEHLPAGRLCARHWRNNPNHPGRQRPVQGVDCTLSNPRGTWTVVTPGAVNVSRSQSLLTVLCNKPGWQNSTDYFSSTQSNAAIIGTALLWGVLESAVDASSGAGNDYPDAIAIQMKPAGAKLSGQS